MEDKKFIILFSVFAIVSLTLVFGLGAIVVFDTMAYKDRSNQNFSKAGASYPNAPSLLE